jgi:hypothetical protein
MKSTSLRHPYGVELAVVTALGWLVFISAPLAQQGLGLSWDAINHHVYLGWTAAAPRFDHDVLAAGYQTYQFPYLYWPLYELASHGASGTVAGIVLASLQALAIPPVWMLMRWLIPGRGLSEILVRTAAVTLGFLSVLVLSFLDSTSNDLLCAIPMLWAIALAAAAASSEPQAHSVVRRRLLLSGVFAGLAVACKLSNGPLAILLPLAWAFAVGQRKERAINVLLACLSTLAAFTAAYAYWGWQLWVHFGNPFYPFMGLASQP